MTRESGKTKVTREAGKGDRQRSSQATHETVFNNHRYAFRIWCRKCCTEISDEVEVDMDYILCKDCK